MTNFLVLRDPDPVRRQVMLTHVASALAPFDGLTLEGRDAGDVAVRWAASPGAPGSAAAGPGGLAIVWGDARPAGEASRLSAERVLADGMPPQPDGYHALLRVDVTGSLDLGTDLFGFFPVYHWTDGEVTLIGASPHLFRQHPRFTVRWSREGLAGILLAQTMVNNQPLLEGVRRLAPGHRLHVPALGRPVERAVYALPWSDACRDLGYSDQVNLLGEALEDAVARATPDGGPSSMLLSGGLDSRALLGAARATGRYPHAVTLGRADDLEAVCARAAARVAGVAYQLRDDTPADPVDAARRRVRWEQVAGGLFATTHWSATPLLAGVAGPILNGYLMDTPMNQHHLPGRLVGRPTEAAEYMVGQVMRWGQPPAVVDRLTGLPGFAEDIQAAWRTRLAASPHGLSRATTVLEAEHRGRFHVGGSLWPIAFAAWPANPMLDQRLLRVICGLPTGAMAERRAERDLVRSRYPALARVSLDRNSWDIQPLSPPLRWMLKDVIARQLGCPLNRPRRGAERRYYHRIGDFNGPVWRAIRREAERARPLAYAMLDPGTLDALLPPPDREVRMEDPFREAAGPKALVGFSLWAAEYLA